MTERLRRLVLPTFALAAVALLVTLSPSVRPLVDQATGGTDPEVTLPPPDTITSANDAADPASAPAPRLWCQPEDCLAWRTLLEIEHDDVAASGDLVIALTDDDETVVALEAATGERRWETAVPREPALEHAAEAGGYDVARHETSLLSTGGLPSEGDGVYIAGPGWVAHIDDEGRHRWSAAAPRETWWASTLEEVALFHGQSTQGPAVGPHEHLAAHDADTGQLRWERHVWGMPRVVDGREAVVVGTAEGRLGRIDAATGEVEWELGVVQGWAPSLGSRILATLPDGSRTLVDPATGEQSPVPFGDGDVYALRSLGDLHVVMVVDRDEVTGGPREATDIEVTAIGDDGEVRWQHRSRYVHPSGECCPALLLDDEEVRLRGTSAELVLDAETGEGLGISRRSIETGDDEVTFMRDDVRVTRRSDSIEIERGSRRVILHGDRDAQILSVDPMVVAGEDELLGVDLSR